MAVSIPQLVRINKKTGSNSYTLYHPQTGAEMVLYAGDSTDHDFDQLTKYNADGSAWTSGNTVYYHVQDVLNKIVSEIHNVTQVLEFMGTATLADLAQAMSQVHKGDVYILTEAFEATNDNGTTWINYPTDTMVVYVDDDSYSIRPTDQSFFLDGWAPLGGTSSIYATKTEAVHSITVDNNGNISFGYASEASANHSAGPTVALASKAIGTISVSASGISGVHVDGSTFSPVGGSMAVTPVSTVAITNTIASGSTDIPTAGAVYEFAGAAGTLKILQSDTGYLVGTSTPAPTTGTAANRTAVGSGIQWSYVAAAGTTPSHYTINARVPYAGQVANTFGIGGWNDPTTTTTATWKEIKYNGSTEKYVSLGGGLGADVDATGNTLNVWIKAGDDSGLTVSTNGLAVSVDTTQGIAIKHDTNQLFVKLDSDELVFDSNSHGIAHKTSGITAGVYSAVSVNSYGHATAGGQSVIFAAGPNDPDLGDLVVGGLAFIGTNGADTDSYSSAGAATSSSVTNAAIDSSPDPTAANS